MDGSEDHYFNDELVLDANTLAILDHEEQKYISQQPAKKRRRTENGWRPGANAFEITDDYEDLPEISVRGDGTYAIQATDSHHKTSLNNLSTAGRQLRHQLRSSATPSPRQLASAKPQSKQSPALLSTPATSQHVKPATALDSQMRGVKDAELHNVAVNNVPQHESLRQQLKELEEQNAKIQAALQEAIDAKLTREGEVTVLRKMMEKNAKEHTAQMASLQAAKEEADRKQLKLQKENREEVERLKTQLVFKQQEFEASTRRLPTPARAKKNRDGPSTPITPWKQAAMPSSSAIESYTINTPQRPQTTTLARPRESPVASKRAPILPGFENSFVTSTPIRPNRRLRLFMPSQASKEPVQTSPTSSPVRRRVQFSSQGDQDNAHMLVDITANAGDDADQMFDPGPNGDVEMDVDVGEAEAEVSPEEYDHPLEFDARAEFLSIVASHKLPPLLEPTIQLLLAAFPLPPDSARNFSGACSQLLDLVASRLEHRSLQMEIDLFCRVLRSMMATLRAGRLYMPLAALLNLAARLLSTVPTFVISLLSPGDVDDVPQIIEQLRDILRVELHPGKQFEEKKLLTKQVLNVVDCLALDIPDGLVPVAGTFLSDNGVLDVMLHSGQPIWLLATSCQILTRFATYPQLIRYFLAPGEAILGPLTRLDYVDRLCAYLTHPSSDHFEELLSFKITILNLFAALSLSSNDAHTALLNSNAVLPYIILFMGHLTNLIWEEDEALVNNENYVKQTVKALNQVLLLLHHLVLGIRPSFNIRQKLHNINSQRGLAQTFHVFIVTVGRLSWATPPEWMNNEDRLVVESLLELARDLQSTVVDDPNEEENFWSAFNVDGKSVDDMDEGELEAQLMSSPS